MTPDVARKCMGRGDSQELLSQAALPVPGLPPALLVNTTVFTLGIR